MEGKKVKHRLGFIGLVLTSAGALGAAHAGGYSGPVYAVVNWSGFYGGVNGGGAWSDFSDQLAYPGTIGGVSPSGGFGGGQIGYNWQNGYFVFGIETDIQGAGISDKTTDSFGDTVKSSLDYFGTVRGRFGYAFGSSLVYFTGGFAYGGIKNEANFPGISNYVRNTTATGYVVGGGWEYKFSPAWSAKLEYQYVDLGRNNPVDSFFGPYAFNGGVVHDDAFQTIRVGVNYFFTPEYVPLK
jgi:outer membrane immunogenic protein